MENLLNELVNQLPKLSNQELAELQSKHTAMSKDIYGELYELSDTPYPSGLKYRINPELSKKEADELFDKWSEENLILREILKESCKSERWNKAPKTSH